MMKTRRTEKLAQMWRNPAVLSLNQMGRAFNR